MKIVASHPTGSEFVRAALKGFNDARILSQFHTSVACFEGTMVDKIAGIKGFAELRRRSFDSGLQPLTQTWPYKEVGRLASDKLKFRSLLQHETGMFSVDAVYRYLDKKVAASLKNSTNAVYSYEDGALHTFRRAKQLGVKCLYDLPIGHWRANRRLLEQEREKWPEWASTLTGFKDSAAKLTNKDEELRLADRIFVASTFTANTLVDYPGTLAQVHVVPYGFPPVGEMRNYDNVARRKLKLLFVGGLSQRKGIANVFSVVEKLGSHVELTVLGRKTTGECAALDAALAKHTWIETMPNAEVLRLMRAHDVLLFPSLFEGFGMVITEAMAQGTPVITTERTAGPDIITDGLNGWLIQAGDDEQLKAAIEKLLQQPQLIAAAGKAAMVTAAKRPWSVYGEELAAAVASL